MDFEFLPQKPEEKKNQCNNLHDGNAYHIVKPLISLTNIAILIYTLIKQVKNIFKRAGSKKTILYDCQSLIEELSDRNVTKVLNLQPTKFRYILTFDIFI